MTRLELLDIIPVLRLDIKQKGQHFNFRCPLCGDSKTDRHKARGWFRKKLAQDSYYFRCFNCGKVLSIREFISEYDHDLYQKLFSKTISQNTFNNLKLKRKLDSIKRQEELQENFKIKTFRFDNKILRPIVEAPRDILNYIKNRKIPEDKYDKIFYGTSNKVLNNKIVFPFFCKNKSLIYGLQFRDYRIKTFRTYIKSRNFKVYNIFDINPNESVYVFESIIDSLFVNNSIASLGVSLPSSIYSYVSKDNLVYFFDNDETGIKVALEFLNTDPDAKVVIVKPRIKDLNDMIMKNYLNYSEIADFLQENTFSGIMARTRLQVKLRSKDYAV